MKKLSVYTEIVLNKKKRQNFDENPKSQNLVQFRQILIKI